ncbi:MAG TPA: hypothetical protein VNA69_19945 [Thermoanaerobaculia bacterium]|nr:hypothetical protein [Thermoanaerobaculia bacterium]
MYDEYWREIDAGGYFQVPIPPALSTRLRPRNMLLRSGTRVLRWAYRDTIERAAMALAAEATARQIDIDGLAAHFRFVIRNRDAADAIRSYIRFLDQISYHLYEISGRRLVDVKTPRDVSFQRLEKQLATGSTKASRRIATAARRVVVNAHGGLTKDGWKLLQSFRNVDTHRFVVGIDHVIYDFGPVSKDDPVRGGYTFGFGDPNDLTYAQFSEPDIRFDDIDKLLRLTMSNAKTALSTLASLRLLVVSGGF